MENEECLLVCLFDLKFVQLEVVYHFKVSGVPLFQIQCFGKMSLGPY